MSVFIETRAETQIYESKYFWVRKDGFPVSPGHLLIISKRPVKDYFELKYWEQKDLIQVLDEMKYRLDQEFKPDGYNIGMNCGEAAGQTVMHFHCHLIPRYNGDCENPRGGVRHCVPGKGDYNAKPQIDEEKVKIAMEWWDTLPMQNLMEPLESWSGYCMKYYPEKTNCQGLTEAEILYVFEQEKGIDLKKISERLKDRELFPTLNAMAKKIVSQIKTKF